MAAPLPPLIAATLGVLLAQLNVTPLRMLPLPSFAVAVICSVPLTAIDGSVEDSVIVEITGGGVVEKAPPPAPQPDMAPMAKKRTRRRVTFCGILDRPPGAPDAVMHARQVKMRLANVSVNQSEKKQRIEASRSSVYREFIY
jgi:hypothetical protein